MLLKILGVGREHARNFTQYPGIKDHIGGWKTYGAETRLLDLRKHPLPFYDPKDTMMISTDMIF